MESCEGCGFVWDEVAVDEVLPRLCDGVAGGL
jgi:hypothetical protein